MLEMIYPKTAKDLHEGLQMKEEFRHWFKAKRKQLGLVEGKDYEIVWGVGSDGRSKRIEDYKLTPLSYTQIIGQGVLRSDFKRDALAEISKDVALVQNLKQCSVSGYIWDNLFYGERCMTSREFAELVQMRHTHVLRDIRKLLETLEQDFSYRKLLDPNLVSVGALEESLSRINKASKEMVDQFTLISYKDSTGRELPEYLLTRDAALQLAARYSPHIVARLLADIREARESLGYFMLALSLLKTSNSKKVQFLYILEAEALSEIKIGISNAPLDRISNLQSGNARQLKLAYLSPCTANAREIEREIHNHFEKYRTADSYRGGKEWFLVNKEEAISFAKRFQYWLGDTTL